MTSNQLQRLLLAQAAQLTRIANEISEGADLKDVCDAAYANVGRTTAIIGNYDIPEVLAHDPKGGPRAG